MMTFNNSSPVGADCSCKDCADRFVGCHDACPKYKQFRVELEALKEARRHEAMLEEYARHSPRPRDRRKK